LGIILPIKRMLKADDDGNFGVGGFVTKNSIGHQIIKKAGKRSRVPTEHLRGIAGVSIGHPQAGPTQHGVLLFWLE